MSNLRKVQVSQNDLGYDAWGRNKVVNDRSIFHGMFTYNVPVSKWQEKINGVIQSNFINATSENGELHLVAGNPLNELTRLSSFRNPRYQPNRGYLYSTAIILPNINGLGKRRFGYFTDQSGAFFELENNELYAVVRTTINTVTTDDRYLIDTTEFDLEKGNVYDIQMQWRGVGNYKFFINLKEVKLISYLGTRVNLTTFNPANPCAFECQNLGDNVEIICGCVDVSSEGGNNNGKTYGSIGVNTLTGEVSLSGYNVPVIAVRSKLSINGLINTRDTLALLASAYSDNRAILRVWATRDFTAITENSQSWADFGDGHLEYIVNDGTGGQMTFDTAKADLIFSCRVNLDETYSTSALFEGRTEIIKTPGDMFVFTLHRENGGSHLGGITYEFAEEI